MRVEILIEHFAGVLAEVPSLAPGVEEPGAEDHDRLARGLFQLDLDRVKFSIDDVDHSVNLLGSYWSSPRLLSEQIHHVCCELFTSLQVRIINYLSSL